MIGKWPVQRGKGQLYQRAAVQKMLRDNIPYHPDTTTKGDRIERRAGIPKIGAMFELLWVSAVLCDHRPPFAVVRIMEKTKPCQVFDVPHTGKLILKLCGRNKHMAFAKQSLLKDIGRSARTPANSNICLFLAEPGAGDCR